MTELHELSPSQGSHRDRKRKGRGPGSGTGKTAGRGHKGQKARSGGNVHPRFEGGQMPLTRRIPKRGFKSVARVQYQIVNIRDLAKVDGDVSPDTLKRAGLIRSASGLVKVLGLGELDAGVAVSAHAFSAAARAKIEAAGGSVTVVGAAPADASPAADARADASPTDASPDADAPADASSDA